MAGAQSRGSLPVCGTGGEALLGIASRYFGKAGGLILAATVALACLKTAVGLLTSCGETFQKMFPGGPSYRAWVVSFGTLSFLIANLGLEKIISFSLPVLMFLYPLAVTLILDLFCLWAEGTLNGEERGKCGQQAPAIRRAE